MLGELNSCKCDCSWFELVDLCVMTHLNTVMCTVFIILQILDTAYKMRISLRDLYWNSILYVMTYGRVWLILCFPAHQIWIKQSAFYLRCYYLMYCRIYFKDVRPGKIRAMSESHINKMSWMSGKCHWCSCLRVLFALMQLFAPLNCPRLFPCWRYGCVRSLSSDCLWMNWWIGTERGQYLKSTATLKAFE